MSDAAFMSSIECNNRPANTAPTFDLARLSKSKEVVDLAPNTLRAYERAGGINFYRQGKAVFFSKTQLAHFIMQGRTRSMPVGGVR
jgi:hypothetical protein